MHATATCLTLLLATLAGAASLEPGAVDGRRGLLLDGRPLLALDTLWVASADWKPVYRAPSDLPAVSGERALDGAHGKVREKLTVGPDRVTLRYEFDFAELADGANLQWVLRLEPSRFDGATIEARAATGGGLRPIAGASAGGLRRLAVLLGGSEVSFEVAASSGDWKFSDQREASWAKCYRLEWNRPFVEAGQRAGWVELTMRRADIDAAALAARVDAALGESVQSLDGTWRAEPPGEAERDVPVPARWEGLPGLRNVHELTYRRTFDVPEAMAGRRLALRFDAVGEFAEVRVNGRSAGRALLGPLPGEFDITDLVPAPSTGNQLEVLVADDTCFSAPKPSNDWRNSRSWLPHGIGANNRKGLFQSVSLRARPPVWLTDARIVTSVREHTLTVTYQIHNTRRDTVHAKLGATVLPWPDGPVALTLAPLDVELPGFVTTTVTITAPWTNPTLWQPDRPALYRLRASLTSADGTPLCRRDDRFGFREVGFEGTQFRLNGIRCNLRGESPSYAERPGWMDTREQAERLVKRALAANFNVVRFHAAPAPPHVLDVCDELGLLVIDESGIYASWGMLMPEHPEFMPECERHLTRWVQRDRNHPAVVLWSAENEGLNVSALSAGQLKRFAAVITAHDATRPVIFDGDGTGLGASPASVKHYVRTIDDLRDRGGRSSGYGRDMRNDIYWAAEYKQDVPLGMGEFLYPETPAMKGAMPELLAQMGLQTRGYRYANWFDIRPYNPFYSGYQTDQGVKPEYSAAWDILTKSFAAVAVFDKEYDALGAFPKPPVLPVGQPAHRTLIVYNDTFADEAVTLEWALLAGDRRLAGETRELRIGLGDHVELPITFTPTAAGPLTLRLISRKAGAETFRDERAFEAR